MLFRLKPLKSTIVLFCAAVFIASCGSDNKKKSSEVVIDSNEIEKDIFADITNAKQIFYSLPSPLESAMLIKSAGASFNENLLNPLKNANLYTNNKSMALNFGIYITDLSYASMFDQVQVTFKYLEVSKKMADGLGISEAINQSTINRLEENINNRDVILDIISESFMSSTAFLKENDRQPLATISLVGGWIEGLYLASQLAGDSPVKDNKMVQRIVDQKLSLDMVMKLLENNKDNKDIADITLSINDLKKVYDKITIKSTPVKAEVDPKSNETILKSTSTSNINQELFAELRKSVETIRSKFTL